MGNSVFGFAYAKFRFARLLGFPLPDLLAIQFLRHRIGKLAQLLLVEFRPELDQRHGPVEQHVQRSIVGIVVALHEREGVGRLCIGVDGSSPEGSAVGQNVEFIE